MKVSIIIPVFNGEAFITRAIQSALNQSLNPFEIIVINDGSNDGTLEELAAFRNKIKVISIPNGGVSNARNKGILASSGDLIAFLDADDIWYENKLKQQVAIFEKFPDVGFSCCDFTYTTGNSNAILNHFARFKNDGDIDFDEPLKSSALEVLIKHNFVGTCSNVMIRRDVLNQVGLFNTNYKQAEDYDLWLRCALVTKFVLQFEALLEKKTHDANLTNNFLETLLFHEKVLLSLQSNTQAKVQIIKIQDQYLRALALVRYDIGNLFYEANQRIKAFEYFFCGLHTAYTTANIKSFIYFFGRKFIRTLSFGLVRNNKS
ncbi:MAG: glycosyltransferase [Methylococcales bacterium]